jgi:ribosome-binding factor A
MKETTRQKKFSRMIQKEITPLLRQALTDRPGVMASAPFVRVSPDLMVVRIYITTFPDDAVENTVKTLNDKSWEIRKELASRIRNEVRKIPEISFYIDDTVAHALQMEQLFKQLQQDKPSPDSTPSSTEEE